MMKKNQNFTSIINLSWLFASGIVLKIIGIGRESVIAHEIGNTILFANFNFLKSIVDFLIAFVIGSPIIESVLIPIYGPVYHKNNSLSFYGLLKSANRIAFYIFLFATISFFFIAGFRYFDDLYTKIEYVILFGSFVSLYFLNSFYFAILKVKGDFKYYSIQLVINTIVGFLLLVILIKYINILSVLLSGILYIPFSNWYISRKINFKIDETHETPALVLPQNSIYYLLALGHSTFIGFFGKTLLGLGVGLDINYYHYAFILIYSFQSLIVQNITSVLLFKLSYNKSDFELKKVLLTSIFLPFSFVLFFYFGGGLCVKLLFEHGKFSKLDTKNVVYFLHYFLMIPFAILCSSQIMLQPFLSNINNEFNKYKKSTINSISISLIVFALISLLLKLTIPSLNNKILVFFLYGTSISILLITSISYRKILKLTSINV